MATAFTWSAASFWIFRLLTGLGIGGEYAAINSAIDELIPARARGWVDLAINGSYWLGASVGAALSFVLLDKSLFAINLGWRLAFGLGAAMGLAIMFVRRNVPESPRWLTIHGREDEAEQLVGSIEERVKRETGRASSTTPATRSRSSQRKATNVFEIARTLFKRYPRRSILGFTLMATQAFIYNAVIFTFSIVLTTFFKVSDSAAPAYLIPFGIANFAGALLLGRLFDTVGRRPMITGTYLISAIGLFLLGLLFNNGTLGSGGFMVVLCGTFFFASAAASAGYLTVSEVFPLETRAMAIALFYALSTGIGGGVGPLLFGSLLGAGTRPASSSATHRLGAHARRRRRCPGSGASTPSRSRSRRSPSPCPRRRRRRHEPACLVPGPLAFERRRTGRPRRARGRGHRRRPAPRGPARRAHAARPRRGAPVGPGPLRPRPAARGARRPRAPGRPAHLGRRRLRERPAFGRGDPPSAACRPPVGLRQRAASGTPG